MIKGLYLHLRILVYWLTHNRVICQVLVRQGAFVIML